MPPFLAALPWVTAFAGGLGQYFQSRDVSKFQKRFKSDQSKRNAISALSLGKVNLASPEPEFKQSGLTRLFQGLGTIGNVAQQGIFASNQLKNQGLQRTLQQQAIDRVRGAGSVYAGQDQAQSPIQPEAVDPAPPRQPEASPMMKSLREPLVQTPTPQQFQDESNAFQLGRSETQREIENERADQSFRDRRQTEIERSNRAREAAQELRSAIAGMRGGGGQQEIDDNKRKAFDAMHTMFRADATYKASSFITRSLQLGLVGFKTGGPEGDLQLAKLLALIQDPTGTVKEAELETVEDVQGFWTKANLNWENLKENDRRRFTDMTSQDLMSLIVNSYEQRRQAMDSIVDRGIMSIGQYPGAPSSEALAKASNVYRLLPLNQFMNSEDISLLRTLNPTGEGFATESIRDRRNLREVPRGGGINLSEVPDSLTMYKLREPKPLESPFAGTPIPEWLR